MIRLENKYIGLVIVIVKHTFYKTQVHFLAALVLPIRNIWQKNYSSFTFGGHLGNK